jgi:hypothetical protein
VAPAAPTERFAHLKPKGLEVTFTKAAALDAARHRPQPRPPYLSADPCGGVAEGQDGHVLRPVQPGDRDFGTGGPLHHGDIIFSGNTQQKEQVGGILREILQEARRPSHPSLDIAASGWRGAWVTGTPVRH